MSHTKALHCVVPVQEMVLLALLLMVSLGLAQDEGWIPLADIPTPRVFVSSRIVDGKAYVIGGGFNDITNTNIVEAYDIATDTWDTAKTPMPTPRVEICTAVVDGRIYAIGGGSSHDPTETFYPVVEAYDPATDEWDTNFMPLFPGRMGAAGGVIDNKIYIAGGLANWSPLSILDELKIFEPSTGSWSTGAPMPTAVYYASAVVFNDLLYVFGGCTNATWLGEPCVQIYDPITDTWTSGAEMEEGRLAHTSNAVDGRIYAIGGISHHNSVESVEIYDPDINEWDMFDDTPGTVLSHGANEFEGHIYVFTGSYAAAPNPTPAVYCYDPALDVDRMGISIPEYSILSEAYPNPFNASTTIGFALPQSGYVTLRILNVLGEEVATPVSERLDSGNYEFDWSGSDHASGVYFYRLEVDEFTETKKMALVR